MQGMQNRRVHMGVRSKADEIADLCRHFQNHCFATHQQATGLLNYHPLHQRPDSDYRDIREYVQIVATDMAQYVRGHCDRLTW